MSIYFKSGNKISTEEQLGKIVKHSISELIIYTYYNMENLNLLSLQRLLQKIKHCLFFVQTFGHNQNIFQNLSIQLKEFSNMQRKKLKIDEAFNFYIILLKISVLLKKLNKNICNKKQLELLDIWIFHTQEQKLKIERRPSAKLEKLCKYYLY